ncbi:NADPH-dependent FMN reductase [Gluconacetobacter tumulisoli]|uniref:NAD(P)H-dependent oxidoreductase n=1 Tax=Gluconacetobacter tumulisoli TaxID=1286189 RepID=A0A7W4PLZ0_9PROT|nr:NAD(P)H-dependent oxidoreductase [Gluconacetobacter tumulisoli]MBB2202660.1 NAD(P)H-dependent oxidoreductase [Gluconacetobacter tumulisoli]
MNRPVLLGIAGSLRQGSVTRGILDALAEAARVQVDLRIAPLDALPLYNQDLDQDRPPPAVAALRHAIIAADGLVIGSPEYNHGMPGVLKNALDWVSRPYGHSALKDKPVLTFTASPASTGGVRAHAQLNETLAANAARIVRRPQIAVAFADAKYRDGHFADRESFDFLLDGLGDLLREIAR